MQKLLHKQQRRRSLLLQSPPAPEASPPNPVPTHQPLFPLASTALRPAAHDIPVSPSRRCRVPDLVYMGEEITDIDLSRMGPAIAYGLPPPSRSAARTSSSPPGLVIKGYQSSGAGLDFKFLDRLAPGGKFLSKEDEARERKEDLQSGRKQERSWTSGWVPGPSMPPWLKNIHGQALDLKPFLLADPVQQRPHTRAHIHVQPGGGEAPVTRPATSPHPTQAPQLPNRPASSPNQEYRYQPHVRQQAQVAAQQRVHVDDIHRVTLSSKSDPVMKARADALGHQVSTTARTSSNARLIAVPPTPK